MTDSPVYDRFRNTDPLLMFEQMLAGGPLNDMTRRAMLENPITRLH